MSFVILSILRRSTYIYSYRHEYYVYRHDVITHVDLYVLNNYLMPRPSSLHIMSHHWWVEWSWHLSTRPNSIARHLSTRFWLKRLPGHKLKLRLKLNNVLFLLLQVISRFVSYSSLWSASWIGQSNGPPQVASLSHDSGVKNHHHFPWHLSSK